MGAVDAPEAVADGPGEPVLQRGGSAGTLHNEKKLVAKFENQ